MEIETMTYVTREQIREFSDNHNSCDAISEALLLTAGCDEARASELWASPSEGQEEQIVALAWKIFWRDFKEFDEPELIWGETVLTPTQND